MSLVLLFSKILLNEEHKRFEKEDGYYKQIAKEVMHNVQNRKENQNERGSADRRW